MIMALYYFDNALRCNIFAELYKCALFLIYKIVIANEALSSAYYSVCLYVAYSNRPLLLRRYLWRIYEIMAALLSYILLISA